MPDNPPKSLSYASPLSDVPWQRSNAHARECFQIGVFGPILIVILGAMGMLIAFLSSWALSLRIPTRVAMMTGAAISLVFATAAPIVGLAYGIIALKEMRTLRYRNRWQAFVGLVVNAVWLAGSATMLYRFFR